MLPATINSDFLPFQFEGMRLQEACFISGNPYFTGRAIGEFLEYDHPDRAIHKTVERNTHIKEFSTLVILTNVEGKRDVTREVRVYDPIGLQLIINKSNQPKALAFQIAVAHLVLAFMQGKIKPKVWSPDRIAAIKQILSHPPTFRRSELVRDLAVREGKTGATVYNWIEKIGDLKTRKGNKRHRSNAGQSLYPQEKQRAITYHTEHPKAGGKEIKKKLGFNISSATINRWLIAA